MFQFLRGQNFQSHRDTRLEFVPGVNVIFGISQAGKSALRKMLQLISENRPGGARYYSNFAPDKGKTIIELGLMEGNTVSIEKSVRRKSDKSKVVEETIYRLNGETFSGVSKDVPDQIRDIFNLTELNMQSQFDAPFLVTSSAGEIARTINRITKLEDVDGWISGLTKRTNEAKNKTEILETQSQEIETELAKYVGFEDLQKEVDDLQKASGDLKNCYRRQLSLDNQLARIEEIDKRLQFLKPALALQDDIESIQAMERQVFLLKRRQDLTQRLKSMDIALQERKTVLGDLQELKSILELEQRRSRLNQSVDRVSRFDDMIEERKALLIDLDGLKEIQIIEEKFYHLDQRLGQMEKIKNEIDKYNSDYTGLKKKKMVILKSTKECPIFALQCPVVKQMAEKVEKI